MDFKAQRGIKENYIPILVFLWKLILDTSYVNFVIPLFGYSGFELNIDPVRIIESYILVILLGFFSPKAIEKVSEFLIYLLFLTVLIPIISYYSLSNASSLYLYYMVVQYLIILLVYRYGSSKYLRFKPINNGTVVAVRLSIVFVFCILVYALFIQGGIKRLNFDMSKIYEVRETSNDLYASGIFGYLLPWTFRVFNILLIVISVQRKKYVYTIIFVLIQIIFFGLTAFKSVLIYPLVLLGSYFIIKAKRKILFFFIALYSVVGISLLQFFTEDKITLSSIFIRRTFFIPSMINFKYYEFFDKNPFVFLSNSVLAPLSAYPYNASPALVIGLYSGYGDESNANTGFLATSYMHFGVLGIVIFPLIVGFLLKFIDTFESKVPQWCILGMLILPFNGLFRSADLTTSILTHGLGVALFIMWLISDMNKSLIKNSKL